MGHSTLFSSLLFVIHRFGPKVEQPIWSFAVFVCKFGEQTTAITRQNRWSDILTALHTQTFKHSQIPFSIVYFTFSQQTVKPSKLIFDSFHLFNSDESELYCIDSIHPDSEQCKLKYHNFFFESYIFLSSFYLLTVLFGLNANRWRNIAGWHFSLNLIIS